jgi:hypothetical protein
MLPHDYEFQGPSFMKGKVQGLAMGEADAVITVLQTRGLTLTEQQKERILSCHNLDIVKGWVRKAVTVPSVDELFED